ncbi:MAG: sugar phosphate isomerase/epimerase [Chloroflexota bacterium]|nr:sugar phosphate isomerase/epimerase [Chloroflexota bacterium]
MNIACGYTIPITLFGIPPSPADHLKAMEIVGQAGFEAIELELYDELIEQHRRDLDQMKAILSNYGMVVPSVMAVEEKMFSVNPDIKAKALHDFAALTDMIAELGAPIVSICGYMPPEIRPMGTELYVGGPPTAVSVGDDFSWDEFWRNAVDVVTQCAAIAKRKGLRLIIETRANDVFSSTDAILNLIKESAADNAGVLFDIAHVHAGKEYLALVIPKLGDQIALVHFSDNDGSQAYHYPPGQGIIDFPAVVGSLKRVGFDGTIVVDISGVDNIVEEAVKARDFFLSLINEVQA